VYCYADGEKPPIGQGLNTDAEITLLNVYKVSPAGSEMLEEDTPLPVKRTNLM
jgi:hypothetical protein